MELPIFTANNASSEMNCFCASQNCKHCFFFQSHHQTLGPITRGKCSLKQFKRTNLILATGSLKLTMFLFSMVLSCLVFLENSVRHSYKFHCGIVGSLAIGQKQTQDLLRNTWGKNWKNWNEFGQVVVGHIDNEKYISMFLSPTLVLLTLAFGQLKRYVCEFQRLQQVKCAFSNQFKLTVIALCQKTSRSSLEKVFFSFFWGGGRRV